MFHMDNMVPYPCSCQRPWLNSVGHKTETMPKVVTVGERLVGRVGGTSKTDGGRGKREDGGYYHNVLPICMKLLKNKLI